MHRPLEPPKGYERFHTEEALFPGMSKRKKKNHTFQDYVTSFKGAWRLYRHSFIHDPEMAAFEESLIKKEQRIIDLRAGAVLKKARKAFGDGQEAAKEESQKIVTALQEKEPEVRKLVQDRVGVLKDALTEFSEGYKETLDGDFTFFGSYPDDDGQEYSSDAVREDNKPLVYKAFSFNHDGSKLEMKSKN